MNGMQGTFALVVAVGAALHATQGAHSAASDPWITTRAKIVLLTSDGVSGSGINVDTVNGDVTLHGKVASRAEKARAEQLVRSIDGVVKVRDLLQVVPEDQQELLETKDDDIKASVALALRDRPALSDVFVQSVNEGVVLLGGEVPTLGAHLQALQVVSRVPGVRRVVSEIESPEQLGEHEIHSERVRAPAGSGTGAVAQATDMLTTSAVKMRLVADSRTPGLGINVDTYGDTVILFGIVNSAAAKAAAEEDAHKVAGVRNVVNDLQVVATSQEQGVKDHDADVETGIEAALSKRGDLAGSDIDVHVSNGVARMTGTVPTHSARLTAAVVARTATGVRAVRDDLRIETN